MKLSVTLNGNTFIAETDSAEVAEGLFDKFLGAQPSAQAIEEVTADLANNRQNLRAAIDKAQIPNSPTT